MAEMTATNARLRGAVILLIALPLFGFGLWLLHLVMAKPLPEWLPAAWRFMPTMNVAAGASAMDRINTGPGMASLFLLVFGVIAAVQGALMLVLGRRSMALLAVMALFVLVLVGSALSEAWLGR